MRISDWSSDVCSSDLQQATAGRSSVPQKNGSTRTLLTVKDDDGQVTSRVRRTVLPGGLRVVTEQMAGVRSASIGVWVGVGSRDETPALHGASHFLEHLLFKGTRERSARSEERRVGTEGVSTCRSRWSPDPDKKK